MTQTPPRQRRTRSQLVLLAAMFFFASILSAQGPNTSQQLIFAGLRSVAQQGQINGVQTDSAGDIYLLLNQGDGVRLLKTDNFGNAVLAQSLLGASGDVGTAIALDPFGNIYVTGTTTSSLLSATSGAAIPNRTGGSINAFVAKFDSGLNPIFVTFTGGSRIAASGIAATSDTVFVTGVIYASDLPVTTNGIQQSPAYGSNQNGFVERFSADGANLVYATYLTGANGDTTPASIAADSTDALYIVGETSATGFPTVDALVPTILSNPSGFLTKLTPLGDGFTFSTFIPGAGLTSIALDTTGQSLLISGSVALGQFPVDVVALPFAPSNYQVLLRIPIDGSTVQSSTLLAPGMQSFVAAGPNGSAWVDGVMTSPMMPLTPLASIGYGFADRVTAGGMIDQTARFGGLPNQSPTYASLPLAITSIAVDSTGEALVAGTIQPTASSSLLSTETYDLPLVGGVTSALPSTLTQAEVTAANCSGSLCAGSAGYLAKLATSASAPALVFSAENLPFIILRNLGTGPANGLQLAATGSTISTNCPTILYAGEECNLLLAGGGSGTLQASTSNGISQSVTFAAFNPTIPPSTIAFFPKELDFGIGTSTSAPTTRIITVTNLGATSQTLKSILDATSNPQAPTTSPFTEVSSDCTLAGPMTLKLLAPGQTCHITIGFTASPSASQDGLVSAEWAIGVGDVFLTGYSQASTLGISSSEIDFGTQFTGGIRLPRFLYLSNSSGSSVPHTPITLPDTSPFHVTDGCASSLPPNSVCQIRIDYLSAANTSVDSTSLAVDDGLSVLISGTTLPRPTATGSTANPNLSVSSTSASFGNAVPITGVSAVTSTVMISNRGASAFQLGISLTGDFTKSSSCGAILTGGQSCSVVITFAPSQPGARQGLLAVTAGSGSSPLYVSLSGSGAAILPPNNGSLPSANVAVGQPTTQFYKVSQAFSSLSAHATGPYTLILVEDLGFGPGTPAASSYVANYTGSCHNCWLGVQFQPTAAGSQPGTLTLSSTPTGSPYLLALSGTGLPLTGLVLSSTNEDFGSVPVHSTSGEQSFQVTNLVSSGSPVLVGIPSTTGDFMALNSPTQCSGTLAYGASCIVKIAFSPTATGNRQGALTLTAGNSTATASLSGTGTSDPGISIDPLALTFANVPGLAATAQTISITNTSSASVQIGAPTSTTSNFTVVSTCATLPANLTCSISVTYLPGPTAVSDSLAIPVTTTLGSPSTTIYRIALSGAYTSATAGLQMTPLQAQFGASAVGQSGPLRQFTITNLTSKSLAVDVSIPRQFALAGPLCPSLGPNASCNVLVEFAPLTNGDIPGTLYAQGMPSDGSANLAGIGYVEGYGTGSGNLTISGALIVGGVFTFGQVTSGQTASQTFTLSNLNPTGSSPITVRRVTSNPPFLSTTNCGAPLPVGQSCSITVTYVPINEVASGTQSPANSSDTGTLTIESDSATGPTVLNFAGQGAAVELSNPSPSAPLATFTLSESSLNFPATSVGDLSPAQAVTLLNTGNVSIHVTGAFATTDYSTQNTCAIVLPGASCVISVSFAPLSVGVHLASLEITSDAAISLEFVSLLANAAPSQLTLSATKLDFGSLLVGTSTTLPIQVTNAGSSPVNFFSLKASGDYSVGGSCPASGSAFAPAGSCTAFVTFAPTSTGVRSGTLSFTTSASTNPLNVALAGIGTQSQLIVTPSAVAFNSIFVGASSSLLVSLFNSGTETITGLSTSASGDYSVTNLCPMTSLTTGQSCTIQVSFAPTATGSRPGVLTIVSSDPGSPLAVALTGTGSQAGGFLLAVNGGSTASTTVTSGSPASYQLLLTPTGGFTGGVALTCTPVSPAEFASCSLLPSTITLTGGDQSSTATINTITSLGGNAALTPISRPLNEAFFCLLFPGLLTVWKGRHHLRRRRMMLLALLFSAGSIFTLGCSDGGDFNTLETPPGVYQYQITASSTSGTPVTETVLLNLTVKSR